MSVAHRIDTHCSCPMEIRWLYSFSLLADVLHFGRAAVALHLSQSALSVQIRNLEAALQVTLFERNRRSVSLTPAGKAFHEDIGRLLREMEAAQRRARRAAAGEEGMIRVAFVSTAALGIIPKVVRHYKHRFPRVRLNIRNLPTTQQVAALLRKEIDVGFIRLPFEADGLAITPLSEEPFVCFLPERHPLAACRRIDPARLHSEPFIIYERRQAPAFYDRILSICAGSGFSPALLQEASEMQTILSMVAAEMGVTILPRSSGSLGTAGVIMRPLVGKWPASAIGVAALAASAEDPFLKRFVEVARELGAASR